MASPDRQFGHLRLEPHKEASTRQPLAHSPLPALALMPLNQHTGDPSQPCVEIGQRVRLGQAIARPQAGLSAWLHAPVAGRVLTIEPQPAPHLGGRETPAIVIENDGTDAVCDDCVPIDDYTALAPDDLLVRIERAGIVGLGGAVFPTAAKLADRRRRPIDHLIVNGVECEPYISCDDALMRARPREVLKGVQVLLHVLDAPGATLAIEEDMPQALASMREALAHAADPRIEIRTLPAFYPAGGERQLVTALTGMEVPHDGLPVDLGIICQNVGTAAAVAQLVDTGMPLVRRVVTVTGEAVAEPCNVDVAIGTGLDRLIAERGGYVQPVERLIMGGSMMGLALPHDAMPVVKGTNCIIAAGPRDIRNRGVEMPCIRCGECARACPAGLLPQQLHWFARGEDLDELDRLGLADCIECGCCDQVCPSRIRLTRQFRLAKAAARLREDERARAAEARFRYEARERRLALEEQERKLRLEERKRRALQSRPARPE